MNLVIVFDLDDTLYPESAFVRSALEAAGEYALSKWGIGGIRESALQLFEAGQRQRIFQDAYAAAGHGILNDSHSAELLNVYRTHQPQALPWFPDALCIIEQLYDRHPLELISDGYMPTQLNKFQALKAGRWIHKPIFTESLGRQYWKPSPKAFEVVMSRHPEKQFIYVADNPTKDFVAPNMLGWGSIQIVRPEGFYQNIPNAADGAPKLKVTSLLDLPAALSKMNLASH